MSFWQNIYGVPDLNHEELPDLNEEVRSNFNGELLPDLNEAFGYSYEQSYQGYVPESNPDNVLSSHNAYGENDYQENVSGSYPENIFSSQHSYVEKSVPIVSYETNQYFESREELVAWVTNRGQSYGFVIVTKRSTSKGVGEQARCVRVELGCTHGGEPKSTATTKRTGSKRMNCPFLLVGRYSTKQCAWKLVVKNETHNHDPAEHLEGHAFARRMSAEECKMVAELHEKNLEPRKIFAAIRKANPDSACVQKDIYNATAKIRREKKVGETPMQVLENMLHSNKYVYYTREDPDTNAVEEIFFVHPRSYEMWRAFPHVLMIDATYKTNKYAFPLVQVVGVTSTSKSFSVAHAFVQKERHSNFDWVLQRIRDMLDMCMEPRVIVTDRDLALMRACASTFPNATKLLCRWHISENIAKYNKKTIGSDWKDFTGLWRALCDSPNVELYDYNADRLQTSLIEANRPHVWKYVQDNWLVPYRQMFVSAWTDQHLNFGQRTTNRVESQHSNLKQYLKSSNNTLDRIVEFVNEVVKSQEIAIKHSFQTCKMKKMTSHKNVKDAHGRELLSELYLRCSHKALDLLESERNKLDYLQQNNKTCGHRLQVTCGLPCACHIEKIESTGCVIPLVAVDAFWKKLNFNPSLIEEEDSDYDTTLEGFKQDVLIQPKIIKKSLISKIRAVIYPIKSTKQAPQVQTETRGRPTKKQQEQRRANDARTLSVTESQQSLPEPSRHSSYTPSQGPGISTPPSYKSVRYQRSRSTTYRDKQTGINFGFPLMEKEADVPACERFEKEIPSWAKPYVLHLEDVKPDGNCGFRAVAVGLGLDQREWLGIRCGMLSELDLHGEMWEEVFGVEDYQRMRSSLNWTVVRPAPIDYWMIMPYAGLLIAEKYLVIVVFLTNSGSQTFFPLTFGPHVRLPHHILTFAHVNGNHFIMVELQRNHPIPTPNILWTHRRTAEAAQWEIMYRPRILEYHQILDRARSVCNSQNIIDLSTL